MPHISSKIIDSKFDMIGLFDLHCWALLYQHWDSPGRFCSSLSSLHLFKTQEREAWVTGCFQGDCDPRTWYQTFYRVNWREFSKNQTPLMLAGRSPLREGVGGRLLLIFTLRRGCRGWSWETDPWTSCWTCDVLSEAAVGVSANHLRPCDVCHTPSLKLSVSALNPAHLPGK